MSKEMAIVVLGLWVAVLPYLGLPSSWKVILFVVSGLAIAILGFFLRGETLGSRSMKKSDHHTFVESVRGSDHQQ